MTDAYEHQLRIWEREAESRLQSRLSMHSAVIAFATLTIKSLLLFNGGAILALLTFYGNALSRTATDPVIHAPSLSIAIGLYVIGTGAGLLCSMSAYFTQVLFTEIDDEKKARYWGNGSRVLAVLLGFASFLFFVFGSLEAASAFIKKDSPSKFGYILEFFGMLPP